MKYIDQFLNTITMYRLVLYSLTIISGIAIIFGFAGILPPYTGLQFIMSLFLILAVSFGSNLAFAKVFKAQTNVESVFITAYILFCLVAPPENISDAIIITAIAVIAQASKYLLAKHKRHIFNPVAIAAVIAGWAGSSAVFWWVGSGVLLPMVAIAGLLIVRKIHRFAMFWSFIITSIVVLSISRFSQGSMGISLITDSIIPFILSTPLIFFATFMLTEPITTPPTKKGQLIYGAIVGALFGSQWSLPLGFMTLSASPELALIIGNIYSYVVSYKKRLVLTVQQKNSLSPQIHELVFTPSEPLRFKAGQYLEWTLPHAKPDDRGFRRYFTIASAPTEKEIRLGVRIFPQSSSFKNSLVALNPGDTISAGSLAGDFTLPEDPNIPLVFIAGGIGITPFRSQIKWLLDTNQKRDIILLYAANTPEDFVYKDIFDTAVTIGLKTVYIIGDMKNVPAGWTGQVGFITTDMIAKVVPDAQKRTWYLSGPNMMVQNYKTLLENTGISTKNIKTDYFPGF